MGFFFRTASRWLTMIPLYWYTIITSKKERKGNDFMKYQIYLQKDVSEMINAIAQGLGMKPATFIKEQLESNYRKAYQDAVKLGVLNNGRKEQRKV